MNGKTLIWAVVIVGLVAVGIVLTRPNDARIAKGSHDMAIVSAGVVTAK